MPTPSGKLNEFNNFYASFNQIIDNEPSFTAITKFSYLLSFLTGTALETVKAFPISEENERIIERYDNPIFIYKETVTELFNMPSMTKHNAQ